MKGLHAHQRRLVGCFFAGIAKGMLHHFGEPTTKGGNGAGGMGHGLGEKLPAWTGRTALANENLLGFPQATQRQPTQRRRRRCWALRLYFSVGVSW